MTDALDFALARDPALAALWQQVQARMATDPAHDAGHLRRVAAWTVRIGDTEGVDWRLALAAALLHDVVNLPKDDPARGAASHRSADVARTLLPPLGFTPADTDAACEAIRDHSYTRGAVPASPLGRALQDADRLDALGALGTLRCVATGVGMGAQLFDDADPWAERRALDDRRFSIDHFFVKLLRLSATFTTAAGRAEADRRAATMRAFLAALGDELGAPVPW